MALVRRDILSRRDFIKQARVPDRKARQFIEHNLKVPLHKMGDAKDYLDVGSKHVWASFRDHGKGHPYWRTYAVT